LEKKRGKLQEKMAGASLPSHLLKVIQQLNAVEKTIEAFDEEFDATGEHWDELDAAVKDAWPVNDARFLRVHKAITGILKAHPDMNLQHIEAWLRRDQLAGVVWITSTTNPNPDRFEMVFLNGTFEKASRSLCVIIREAPPAMNEILAQEGIETYEDNFKLLADTGILCEKGFLARQQQQ
jgi:hypothetical protein